MDGEIMPIIKTVQAKDYKWSQVYGLSEMLTWPSGRAKKGEVNVVNTEDASYNGKESGKIFGSYGNRLQYVDEASEFTDGSILLCASVSECMGTFAIHDNISVKYYTLEPK